MKKLLEYIVEGITGSDNFTVKEVVDEDKIDLTIHTPTDIIGLIIGKGGNTIWSIRNLLKVNATLSHKVVFVKVEEKESVS